MLTYFLSSFTRLKNSFNFTLASGLNVLSVFIKEYNTKELQELIAYSQFSDLETRVQLLDKYGIDKQVLTLARPNVWLGMPKDLMLEMTRKANDAVAEAAEEFPDRFIAVGTLPYLGEEFLAEFDRCMSELGMAGIQIFSNIGGLLV